ncbi:hypothetical protein [Micromonospora vinacea]|uniref:hypothetical protein n=1 Tax=Micromonospora vinacea TaxID=709878 RepID=UPI003F55CA42
MCRQHDVAAIVVRQAINALKIEGLVEGGGGLGVFVAERFRRSPVPRRSRSWTVSVTS